MDRLWAGADVRWVGPERRAGDVRLRHGDRAVVVDPGRYAVRSFTALYRLEGERPPRPGRGVVVEVAGGPAVRVARRHLELAAPDHPLRPEPDAGAADWFLEQLEPWGEGFIAVASLVPRDLPAVARVLHPWEEEGVQPARLAPWSEVAARGGFTDLRALVATREATGGILTVDGYGRLPPGELDQVTAAALVDALARFTSTPDDVYVAVWTGWGDVPTQRFPGAAVIPTEARGHVLLRGPLDGVLTSVAVGRLDRPASGIWWPSDRAWLVVTEVDFEWTFVGGSDDLVDALLGDAGLEAVRTHPGNPAHLPEVDVPR